MAGAIFLSCPGHAATPAAPELRLGVAAVDVPADMYRRLDPLTKYLSDTLRRPVTIKLLPNMAALVDEITRNGVDLAYLTPEAYLESRSRSDTRLVVKTVVHGRRATRLTIVVRDASPVTRVAELKGKTFAFGDKAAVLPRAVLTGAGMPLEQLGEYRFLGHSDNIARSILNGDVEAGIVTDSVALKWQGKGLRVLFSSPELPNDNITVGGKVDDGLFRQLTEAFLRLDIGHPPHRAVIQALDREHDGFVATSDVEYEAVRRLIAPPARK